VGGIWDPVCRVCGYGVNALVGTGKADEVILTLGRVIAVNVCILVVLVIWCLVMTGSCFVRRWTCGLLGEMLVNVELGRLGTVDSDVCNRVWKPNFLFILLVAKKKGISPKVLVTRICAH
jgi:hypothetical protein